MPILTLNLPFRIFACYQHSYPRRTHHGQPRRSDSSWSSVKRGQRNIRPRNQLGVCTKVCSHSLRLCNYNSSSTNSTNLWAIIVNLQYVPPGSTRDLPSFISSTACSYYNTIVCTLSSHHIYYCQYITLSHMHHSIKISTHYASWGWRYSPFLIFLFLQCISTFIFCHCTSVLYDDAMIDPHLFLSPESWAYL